MVSVLSFSQSIVKKEAVLTPLEMEYLYIVSRNDRLDSFNMELLKIIDSLNGVILKTSSHSSSSGLWPQTPEWVKLGTGIKMLNVYRTPYSFYLTLRVPLMNNEMTVHPHLPDFYNENYEFYYRPISSTNLCTNRKESSTFYIDD